MYIFQPDRFLLQEQLRSVSKYLKGKMLDVGAGDVDRYGKYFAVSSIVRMDVHKGPNVDVVGSADNIPFPDNSFDSVLCTQVFEHLQYPQKSATELSRVLKRGGYAIITAPQMNELHEEPYDFFRYTKFGLDCVFSDAGFEVVECLQRGGYFAMLAQIRIRHFLDSYRLYKRPVLGKMVAKCLAVYARIMLWRDKQDMSEAGRKHAIGWCIVVKKK